jgi:hypothetical protein
MAGLVSFLFLLLVVSALAYCGVTLVRLLADAAFPDHRTAMTEVRRPCPDPRCRRDNRVGARFCAQCGRPLVPAGGSADKGRSSLVGPANR